MNRSSQLVWERALESLDDADANLRDERYLVTVNRSYYTAFYALSALLYEEGYLNTKSHSGSQAKFRELFIKTGLLPKEASLWLNKTWELRQAGDYDFEDGITVDEATEALESARQFLEAVGTYLRSSGGLQ